MAQIQFGVDRTNIRPGECVTFQWDVEGVQAIYFFHDGQKWQDHGVTGHERRQECPSQSITYHLRVIKTDGSHEQPSIRIEVSAGAGVPEIRRFSLNPSGGIPEGKCLKVNWKVVGQVSHVRVTGGKRTLWDGAPVEGEIQDCPPHAGRITYRIEVSGPGGTTRAEQVTTVGSGQPVQPPKPQPPAQQRSQGKGRAVIEEFNVNPGQIRAGACVTLSWRCGGDTAWVNIFRGEHQVMENAPRSGSTQDCPNQPGDYNYRLIAYDSDDKRKRMDRSLRVTS